MSNCDRSERTSVVDWFVPAIYVVGALFITGMIFSNIAGYHPSAYQKQYDAQCDEAKSRYWVVIDGSFKSLTANEDTESGKREKNAREQVTYWCDLFAQQSSADATSHAAAQSHWATLLTAIGVLLIAGTLFYTRGALKAANQTLTQSEKTTKAIIDEQRPWLSIEDPKIISIRPVNIGREKLPESREYKVEISCNIRNRGKMPAHFVTARSGCVKAFIEPIDPPQGYAGAIFHGRIYEIGAERHVADRLKYSLIGHEKTVAPDASILPDRDTQAEPFIAISRKFENGHQFQYKVAISVIYYSNDRREKFTSWKIFSIRGGTEYSSAACPHLCFDFFGHEIEENSFLRAMRLVELKGEMT